ncbi:hypothetical protein X975_17400, partial [Stegodyphus mimosarum]
MPTNQIQSTDKDIRILLSSVYFQFPVMSKIRQSWGGRQIFQDKKEDEQFAPADVLQPSETPVSPSSSDDDEDRSDNENKRFRTVLEKISPRAKKNPNPTGPSSSRSAQKEVEIISSPYKSRLYQSLKRKNQFPKFHKMQKHKKETGDSWFCILCEETKEEEMIQCMKCQD